MLVHYNGDRVKLAAEYANPEDSNNTQMPFQPVNQQANPVSAPVAPKGLKPAAAPAAPAASRPQTPTIYNPTLARMGINLPPPKNPTEVTSKLSQAILRRSEKMAMDNITVRDTMKHRDYYDSPYLSDLQHARLKVKAPIMGESDTLHGNVLSGGLATAGVLAGSLLGRGALGKVVGSGAGAALGFLAGKAYNRYRVKNELSQFEPYLYLNKDR